jgi:predicted dehydrogenase
MRETTSLAVVGSGLWAQRHMAAISATPGLNLAGIVSSSLIDQPRPIHGDVGPTQIWPDIDIMLLEKKHPDGVILATEPHRMLGICERLLGKGIPVLAEKPLTLSARDALRIVTLAERMNGLIMVNLIHLFGAGYIALKRNLKEIGELKELSSEGGNQGPFREYMSGLWDYGPHDLAFALDLVKLSPINLAVNLLSGDRQRHVIDVKLEFLNGVRVNLKFGNLMAEKRRRLRCEGEVGVLELEDHPSPNLFMNHKVVPLSGPLPLNNVHSHFVKSIAAGTDSMGTAALACEINCIIERIEAEI